MKKSALRFATVATVSLIILIILIMVASGGAMNGMTPAEAAPMTTPFKMTVESALSSDNEVMADGSFYQTQPVYIPAGYPVNITLMSSDFDTYVLVVPPDGSKEQANDDCDVSDLAKGSCLSFVTHVGGEWKFVANSVGAGNEGKYQLSVNATKR